MSCSLSQSFRALCRQDECVVSLQPNIAFVCITVRDWVILKASFSSFICICIMFIPCLTSGFPSLSQYVLRAFCLKQCKDLRQCSGLDTERWQQNLNNLTYLWLTKPRPYNLCDLKNRKGMRELRHKNVFSDINMEMVQ